MFGPDIGASGFGAHAFSLVLPDTPSLESLLALAELRLAMEGSAAALAALRRNCSACCRLPFNPSPTADYGALPASDPQNSGAPAAQ